MIQIRDVSFRYSNSEEMALEHIDLHIEKGEFVVLLGSSGCGKTTITRLINRLVPEFFEGEISGKVLIDGRDTAEMVIQDLTGTVGSVFQDPRSQFFCTDTTAELAFSCENAGLPREDILERIEKAVNDLNIRHLLEQSIFELSSGEKQSIAIGSVYALEPKILVLDEPSANLDALATTHLMEILNVLKTRGFTIVVSEHRIHYLKDIADRAILIKKGRIEKELSREEFRKMTNAQANEMGLRSVNLTQIKASSAPVLPEGEFLKIDNITFGFDKNHTVLEDVSFAAGKGSIIGIVGNNGVGKSTLLEIVCGLQKEKSGSIVVDGSAVKAKSRIEGTFLVMQNSDCQLFSDSVENELYLGSSKDSLQKDKGQALLDRMGLSEYLQHHPASLSGGQKQRLCIAVACMKNPDIICFDEPTSGLDYESMLRVSDLLHELASEGKVLLVTSHDYEFLMAACTHICHLKEGRTADFYPVNKETALKTYGILFPEQEQAVS